MTTAKSRRGIRRYGTVVKVRVDPKRRKRYDKLLAEMARSSRREAGGFDAFWEAVGEILDAELYVAGGYETPRAFVEQEVKEKLRTARRNVRVATHSSPRDEDKYGTALLDAAIGYMVAKTGKALGEKLPMKYTALRFKVERRGKKVSLGLADVTVDEIQAATAKLLAKRGVSRVKQSDEERALIAALKTNKALSGVTVGVSEDHARFGQVPLEALAELGRMLVATQGEISAARKKSRAKSSKKRPKKSG
jgi:hypothetical protein